MHELSKMPQKRKNTLIQGISFVNAGHTNPQKKKENAIKIQLLDFLKLC